MEFLTYGNMSDPYFLLIHHLMGVKNSFYHAPFAVVSYASDLSQAATSKSLDYAKYDFLSLSDSFLYVQCDKTRPWHSVYGACLSFTPNLQTDFPFVNQQTPLYLSPSCPWLLRINPQQHFFPQTAPIVRTQKSNNPSPLRIVRIVQLN